MTSSYGKTILVNLTNGQSSIYTLGHRNPQGLVIDANGDIWLTEHGPQGGDELNHIAQGRNYGWPLVTYGRNYGQLVWPLNSLHGRHEGFQAPAYAWVPSVGISNLLSVRPGLFEHWKNDLLIGTLGDESIYRVRVGIDRVLLTERIAIQERVRDIAQDANGRLILWTEEAITAPTNTAIVVIEPVADGNKDAMVGLTEREQGELLFDRCSGCHRVENGLSHGIGPDLKGLFGRPAAAAPGYNYTDSLKRMSGSWTDDSLDAFLQDPESLTPGTSMQFDGMADPAERASLIEYLKSTSEE
jgi:cytochrome c2